MDTKLFVRNQPGGLFCVVDREFVTGSVFWVNSSTGTDAAGYGQNPDAPVATLDYAVGLCTANAGDIIFLAPGHAEDLASATAAACDIAGVQIIGLGYGTKVPTFTLGTATTATIAVTAANVSFSNIKIVSDLADVAAGITASAAADGLTIDNCWFTDGGADDEELVIGVSCAADCDNVTIRNSKFTTVDGGGCASGVKFVGATDHSKVIGCTFVGDYSVACVDGGTAAGTYVELLDNNAWNTDVTAGLALKLHASTTGVVRGNIMFGGKDGTSPLAATGCLCGQNYYTNSLAASAALLTPATDA